VQTYTPQSLPLCDTRDSLLSTQLLKLFEFARILTFPNDHYDPKQSDTQPEISSKLSASLPLPPPPDLSKAAGLTGLTCYHPRPPNRVLQVSQIIRCSNSVDISIIIASNPTFIGTAELMRQIRFDLILMTRSPGLTSILLTLKPSFGRIVQSLDRTQETKCDDYDPVSFRRAELYKGLR
jgi:hypothetical protein